VRPEELLAIRRAFPRENGICSFVREGPVGQEEGAYARMAEPVPCEVGVQVPRGDHSEVPPESHRCKARVRTTAPNGGYLTLTASSGGLPNATASGRGYLLLMATPSEA
jgi:hypothetical protein